MSATAGECTTVASRIDVDRLEFVVLVAAADIERIPMIASYSHYGTPLRQMAREFDAAEQRCRQRGLIDPGGRLNDEVRELLGVYPHTSLEYDLRFSGKKGTELRACVSRSADGAVRTVVHGDRIILDAVRPEEAIPALVAVLPDHRPAKIKPLSVDLAELRAVMAEVERRGETDPRAIEAGLRSRGANVTDYRTMSQLLDGSKLGAGELGVTVWSSGREFRGDQTVRTIDLESGRVAVYNSAGRRMVAACDLGTFKRLLGDIAGEARRNADWTPR